MNRGAFDFLTKPLNLDDLGITVDRALQHVQQVRQTLAIAEQAQQAREELSRQIAYRESEQRLTQFLDAVPVGVFVIDATGRPYYANQTANQILGQAQVLPDGRVNPELLTGFRQAETLADYPNDRLPIVQALNGNSTTVDDVVLHLDERVIPLEVSATPIVDERGQVEYAIAAFQDITQRKQAEAERFKFEKRFRALIENSLDLILVLDVNGCIQYRSPSAARALGVESKSATQPFWEFVHADDRNLMLHTFKYAIERPDEKQTLSELRLCPSERGWEIFEITFSNLLHEPVVQGIVVNAHNITARKLAEEKLLHDALHDALTNLPNRALFFERLSQAIARYRRHSSDLFAVLFLDLDRFKLVNDSLGHDAGDRLLIEAAQRLQDCLREGDTVARLGGDEFALLLESIEGLAIAEAIADRCKAALEAPFELNRKAICVSASIGIALPNGMPDSPSDILRNADTAMYHAKALGKSRRAVFAPSMYAQNLATLQLEIDLRRALELDELQVYYQPIVLLANGQISGFEALIRWQHPEQGCLNPSSFIELAEESGLIVPIGWWLCRQACQQLHTWQRQFPHYSLTININLSGRQFSQPTLAEQVQTILQETALTPQSLKLEITETTIMESPETVRQTLAALKAMNVQLNIDDFGTGYSSLSRLQSFPIDTLKIDRSFVTAMAQDPQNLEIVRAIISMADSLGIDTVAEGVETAAQLEQLRAMNCKYGQGYWFAEALSAERAAALLAEQRCW
ncbi:MAG: EAL domain-containing protein [Spirulinaceae cyanobacterium SM2_1_0]|nr:EAL domain-containing protein [Spirulinaceae cyanobacterium SM2_1_0]